MTANEISSGELYLGESRLCTYPKPDFTEALERFYTEETRRKFGSATLALRSTQALAVYSLPTDTHQQHKRIISVAKLAAIDTTLTSRGGIHPTIEPDVQVKRHLPYPNALPEHHGLELLFTARIDAFIARVLSDVALIDPSHRLQLNYIIPREKLQTNTQNLIDARDNLRSLLFNAQNSSLPVRTDGLFFNRPPGIR
jgi:hypothetical protein